MEQLLWPPAFRVEYINWILGGSVPVAWEEQFNLVCKGSMTLKKLVVASFLRKRMMGTNARSTVQWTVWKSKINLILGLLPLQPNIIILLKTIFNSPSVILISQRGSGIHPIHASNSHWNTREKNKSTCLKCVKTCKYPAWDNGKHKKLIKP